MDHKGRLETTIQSLEQEKRKLLAQVNKGLTVEQEELIKDFAARVEPGLPLADDDFQARRQIIELLNVTATLTRENGQKVAYVTCMLGENVFEINQKKARNNGDSGSDDSQIGFNSFSMGGKTSSLLCWRQAFESSSPTSAATT